jgi:hypothetical protein
MPASKQPRGLGLVTCHLERYTAVRAMHFILQVQDSCAPRWWPDRSALLGNPLQA